MRRGLFITAFSLLTAAAYAAPLISTNADALTFGCAFNTNCTNIVRIDVSPITLPGATGSGLLETRVIRGELGASAAGLYGYFYRLDLTGVTAVQTNQQPCFTNVTRCFTNLVLGTSNVVTCRTNPGGRMIFCSTNVFPATNIVCCVTNFVPATNFMRCVTTPAGETFCFTNTFPATNLVLCFTNRVPQRRQIICQTNQFGATNLLACVTNQVRVLSNLVVCATNTVPCQDVASCIDAITIPFGRIVSHNDFSPVLTNGAQVVVVSNSVGTITPASVEQNGPLVTIRFSPPVCAGDSSLYVGLLSDERPRDSEARLSLLSGRVIHADVLAPRIDDDDRRCDFDELEDLLEDLSSRSFAGSNQRSREQHRHALLGLIDDLEDAADERDWAFVFEALWFIAGRSDADSDDWITGDAAQRVQRLITSLLECLESGPENDNDNDDDKDDDDDDKDNKDDKDDEDRRRERGRGKH